jgi:hypothetical protein
VASRRSWRLGSARDEHNWLSLQCFRQADGLELVVIWRVAVEKVTELVLANAFRLTL